MFTGAGADTSTIRSDSGVMLVMFKLESVMIECLENMEEDLISFVSFLYTRAYDAKEDSLVTAMRRVE